MSALEFEGQTWSGASFDAQVQQEADRLKADGAGSGKIEMFDAPCTPDTLWRLHALRQLRASCVVISPEATEEERSHIRAQVSRVSSEKSQAVALWVPTSGTTGIPRLVGLTEQQLLASADASRARLDHDDADRWLCCLPLHHIGGLSIALRTVRYGTTMVLHPHFDAKAVSDSIDRNGITQVSMVPTMLQRVLDARQDRPFPSSLRFILLGGAPAPPSLIDRCRANQAPVALTWGMTETGSQIATRTPGDLRPDADVGFPLPGMTVHIDAGSLVVSGPIAPNGNFRTEDRGALDTEGRVIVYGRGTDLIISGGENIDPRAIERILLSHPDVKDCAVVGRSHPEWGERPVAFVAGPRCPDLKAWLEGRLQPFQRPDELFWLDTLPRNSMGKLDRTSLREQANGAHGLGKFRGG